LQGYFLPCVGFSKVIEHGLSFYQDTGVEFVLIPTTCTIRVTENDQECKTYTHNTGQYALPVMNGDSDDDSDTIIQIDDKKFHVDLAELY
jgi:hypothetical protein